MLHRVAGGQITPPRRAGSLTEPLLRMLAAEPADRPAMTEVRDELAKLAAGRDGDTTTVLLARTDLGSPDRAATGPPRSRPAARRTTRVRAARRAGADPAPAAVRHRRSPAAAPASSDGSAPAAAAPPRGAAPAPTPDRTPAARPRTPGRRRGRALWLLVALVAVVLAGLIVFWAVALDDPDDASDAQTPDVGRRRRAPSRRQRGAGRPPSRRRASATETSAERHDRGTGRRRSAVGGQHHGLPRGLPRAGAVRPARRVRPDRSDPAGHHRRGRLRRLLEPVLRRPASATSRPRTGRPPRRRRWSWSTPTARASRGGTSSRSSSRTAS